MDNGQSVRMGQSVCTKISQAHHTSLFREVKKNGGSAINNRKNRAIHLRKEGLIEEAEVAEREAKMMLEIARKNGF